MLPPAEQALTWYRDHGYTVVPLRPREKRPYVKTWQTMPADDLAALWKPGDNLGLRLDNGLVDIDLDHPVARTVTPLFLPATGMVSGRATAPRSHYWYVAEGLAGGTYTDITGEMLLEIRTAPRQTMGWPSRHPSGEIVEWEAGGLEPAVVDHRLLAVAVGAGAAATLLVLHWPEHQRHYTSLALASVLLRNGWDVERVVGFVDAVADAAGDEQPDDRRRAIRDTAARLRDGKPCTGLPTLRRTLPAGVVDRLAEWLFLDDATEEVVEPEPDLDNPEKPNPIPYILSFGAFVAYPFPTPEWLIKGFLHMLDINFTVAPPKSLKTWLEMYMHLCIASGEPLFGRYEVGAPRVTVYVQDDQSAGSFQQRFIRLAKGMAIPTERLDDNLKLIVNQGVRFNDTAAMTKLVAEVARYRPALITFDTFRSAHALDENDSTEMTVVMDTVKRVRDQWDVAISLVHHTVKNLHAGDVGVTVRGSGAIWGAADNLIAVQKEVTNEIKYGLVSFDGRGHDWAAPFKFHVEDTPEGWARLRLSEIDRRVERDRAQDDRLNQWRDYLVGADRWVTQKDAERAMGVSDNTAAKWLGRLVDEGLADRMLEGRVAFYSAPRGRAWADF